MSQDVHVTKDTEGDSVGLVFKIYFTDIEEDVALGKQRFVYDAAERLRPCADAAVSGGIVHPH